MGHQNISVFGFGFKYDHNLLSFDVMNVCFCCTGLRQYFTSPLYFIGCPVSQHQELIRLEGCLIFEHTVLWNPYTVQCRANGT
jgi:hypothetical protein